MLNNCSVLLLNFSAQELVRFFQFGQKKCKKKYYNAIRSIIDGNFGALSGINQRYQHTTLWMDPFGPLWTCQTREFIGGISFCAKWTPLACAERFLNFQKYIQFECHCRFVWRWKSLTTMWFCRKAHSLSHCTTTLEANNSNCMDQWNKKKRFSLPLRGSTMVSKLWRVLTRLWSTPLV